MSATEKRRHARISALLDAQLEANGEQAVCRVRDLSLGGALVECSHLQVRLRQAVVLMLPPLENKGPAPVPGKCVRFNVEAGVVRYGLEFAPDIPDRTALVAWLRALQHVPGPDDRRVSPRIRRRVEVKLFGSVECKGVLDDISAGGMAYVGSQALAVGETVTVELVSAFGTTLLDAEVLRSEASANATYSGALRFTHPPGQASAALQSWVQRLILEEGSGSR